MPRAKCATGDTSNNYLNSDLPKVEYIWFRMDLIPGAFVCRYNLYTMIAPDGFIYTRMNKMWYGLKQAGRIAHDDMVQHLAADRKYIIADLIKGCFCHKTHNIDFTLVK